MAYLHSAAKKNGATNRQGMPMTYSERPTEIGYCAELSNDAYGWSEKFSHRPPSKRDTYDDYGDYFLSEVCEARRYDEFEEGSDDSIYRSARKRSSSKRRHRQGKRGSASTKRKKGSATKSSSDQKSGSRRLKKVASGWTELFSTISEQPTMEEAEQERHSFLKCLDINNTSTLTLLQAPGAAAASSSGAMFPVPPTSGACSSKEVFALCPLEPMPECGVHPEASITTSVKNELVDSGSDLSYGNRHSAEQVRSLDAVNGREVVPACGNLSGGPSAFLCSELLPTLWFEREEQAGHDILTELSTIPLCFNNGGTAEVPVETPLVKNPHGPYIKLPGKKIGRGLPRPPTAYKKLVEVDRMMHPDRGCALVLAVGLLIAVFIVASSFLARGRLPWGLLSPGRPENS
ncbi:hypothetical protein V5799_007001 [Amblyomma americanum]|uniref:Uncharacterized protein n=1 Tax=Amblyomma americanum TaxID=6943 RepID=A0AAQ4DUS8_AMBAM